MQVTLPDNTVISYVHDPLGRRIAKLIDGVISEKYLWAGQTTLLAVYDGYDNLLQRFEYADDRMPPTMTADGGVYYLAYDQVGSLRLVSDSGGNIVKQIDYDTFGNIIADSNPSFTIPFGFAGGLHDRDTNLVRFGYRDYMPEIGKWTAKDPIDFAAGDSNLYGYVQNDPVNLVDPEGLQGNPFNFSARDYFKPQTDAITNAATGAVNNSVTAIAKGPNGIPQPSGSTQSIGLVVGGTAVTTIGIAHGNFPLSMAGAALLAEGLVRCGAEAMGGDTSNLPYPPEILIEIGSGVNNAYKNSGGEK